MTPNGNKPSQVSVVDGMLTTDQARHVIWQITYKPGWCFNIEYKNIDGGRLTLIITAYVQHSETMQFVNFDIKRLIPECALTTGSTLVSWVQDMLIEAEIHELREFFRYKGELVDDPHKNVPVRSET